MAASNKDTDARLLVTALTGKEPLVEDAPSGVHLQDGTELTNNQVSVTWALWNKWMDYTLSLNKLHKQKKRKE